MYWKNKTFAPKNIADSICVCGNYQMNGIGSNSWEVHGREDIMEYRSQRRFLGRGRPKKKKKQYCIGEEKAVRQHI